MIIGFGNNTVSSLAADITANQTTIQVMPGEGAKFAKLLSSDYVNTSNPLKVYAKITLTDAKETVFEVCHLTAVNNDMLTVVRGQEGTTAKGWALNDVVANFATRGSENQFVQIEQLQSGNYTSAVAGGSANALTIELPATYFVNSSTDWALRVPIVVYPTQNNTGASTLQLVMGGRVLGTFPLYKGDKAQLVANDILKDVGLVCLMDKTKTFFNVANPGAIYAGLGTAAFHNVQTSPTDTASGAVLMNGAWGIGSSGITMKDSDILSPTGIGNAFFVQGGGEDNHYGSYGAGVHLSYGTGGGNTVRLSANLFVDPTGNLSIEWLEINLSDGSVKNQKLQKLYGPLNKPTAVDVAAFPNHGIITAGTDLNTLTGTKEGFYFQATSASATAALNYPVSAAGSLCVIRNGANGNDGCTQEYRPYNSTVIYSRTYDLASKTWSAWDYSHTKNHPQDLSSYMKTTDANARFVTGTRFGANKNVTWGSGGGTVPGGCALTGGNFDTDTEYAIYAYMQYCINGTWINASGGVGAMAQTSSAHYKKVPKSGVSKLINIQPYQPENPALTTQHYIDEQGFDWFEVASKLRGTVFIAFDPATGTILQIADSRLPDTDALSLHPAGVSIVGLDSIPDGCNIDGGWLYTQTGEIIRNHAFDVKQAQRELLRRQNQANSIILPLERAVKYGLATDEEKARLEAWERYSIALSRIDLSTAPDVDWPEIPGK